MAKIFISHSSKDKEFARKLTSQLTELGHEPWLDEQQIDVGECIVSKIEDGLSSCDYVVVVLSSDFIESKWADKEWKTKIWDEVTKGEVIVLPLLLKECEIPDLLKTKKYADFTKDYCIGFYNLVKKIQPSVHDNKQDIYMLRVSLT